MVHSKFCQIHMCTLVYEGRGKQRVTSLETVPLWSPERDARGWFRGEVRCGTLRILTKQNLCVSRLSHPGAGSVSV